MTYREQVKNVPDKLDDFLARKHYLHATDLIVSAGTTIQNSSCLHAQFKTSTLCLEMITC